MLSNVTWVSIVMSPCDLQPEAERDHSFTFFRIILSSDGGLCGCCSGCIPC